MTFICRSTSVDIWLLHWIFILKYREKKIDVNTRYPRLARRDFRGVLDESLFLYLEFDMDLKNWGNCEVLWSIGGFAIFIIINLLVLYGILRCAAMILYANLDFFCIDHFIPTVASLSWCVFVYMYIFYLFLYAAFINYSEVHFCVCYSACFHTINFYAFVFRTLPSLLLLLIDRRPPWSSAYPLSGGGTLPMPYHRSFNNLFITFFLFIIHFVFLFYFK